MRYADFIDELRTLLAEADALKQQRVTHIDPKFRNWRYRTESLVREAKAHGYRLPGDYNSASRSYLNIYDASEHGMINALAKDIADSQIELAFLIDRFDRFGQPDLERGPRAVHQSAAASDPATFSDRVRKHWLVALIAFVAAISGGTWKLAHELFVRPRDERIHALEGELVKLTESNKAQPDELGTRDAVNVQRLSIKQGEADTTSDGRCAIRVDTIGDQAVSLTVTVDDQIPRAFGNQPVGNRIRIDARPDVYFIDLQRIRGNIADFVVSAQSY